MTAWWWCVDSGPGQPEAVYAAAVQALAQEVPRECLAGYVHLLWGDRPAAVVMQQVDLWQERYPVGAMMLDEFPSQPHAPTVNLLQELRSTGLRLVANPGCPLAPAWARRLDGLLDAVCTYEGRPENAPAEVGPLPAGALSWRLLHGCQPGVTQESLPWAGADLGWATHATLPNPWDGSPLAREAGAPASCM